MRKKHVLGVLLVLVLVLVLAMWTGCAKDGSATATETGVTSQKISADRARELMNAEPHAVVVDVRTPTEYAQRRIPGAINLPNETLTNEQRPAELPDLDHIILVYCQSGGRSSQATRKLLALGYTNVYDFGGIGSWPYETEP